VDLLGSEGYVGTPRKNLAQLMTLNLAVLWDPWLNRRVAQRLMGSWVFPLLCRLEAFAIAHAIFQDVQKLPERKPGPLSKGGQDELLCLLLVAPLLRHNIYWPVEAVL